MTTQYQACCTWCGASLAGRKRQTRYCSRPCFDAARNTRMLRSESVYELLITLGRGKRQERGPALTDLCRTAREWLAEDKARLAT